MLVPLCFEKLMWTTVAMLGVLKAGGGFVLLDPSLPEQRLQSIVRQVKGSLVLSSLSNQVLSSRPTQDRVIINSDFTADLGDQTNLFLSGASLSLVMYVVFTLGSTGILKSIMISHIGFSSTLYY